MTGDIRRSVGYLFVGSATLFAPVLDGRVSETVAAIGTIAPFALLATIAIFSTRGPLFELFARTGDRKENRLYSLASFALAVTALAVLYLALGLPLIAFVASVFILTAGDLGQRLVLSRIPVPVVGASAFAVFGALVGTGAVSLVGTFGDYAASAPTVIFVVTSGAIIGALVRTTVSPLDDSIVLLSVALIIWFLLGLGLDPGLDRLAIGLGVTVVLGCMAYVLGTASTTGTLSGILFSLWAIVLGGYGWFVLLITFFGLGGLASKYRYKEKLDRGIAEENDGARGGSNVFANSAAALLAVVGYAASEPLGVDPLVFKFAFGGAVAAALADTFSSEFGGLFDSPRLITTLEPVELGTDGGVTWQGAIAGVVGSGIIAALAVLSFEFNVTAAVTVLCVGILGMVADSILGATLEGGWFGNQTVNLLATMSAGLGGAIAALAVFV